MRGYESYDAAPIYGEVEAAAEMSLLSGLRVSDGLQEGRATRRRETEQLRRSSRDGRSKARRMGTGLRETKHGVRVAAVRVVIAGRRRPAVTESKRERMRPPRKAAKAAWTRV
jgi:hypothetical protein